MAENDGPVLALRDGHKLVSQSREWFLQLQDAGMLFLPTGAIVACDPLTSLDTSPFRQKAPPGSYPVVLSVARGAEVDELVAFATVRFSDEEPLSWRVALTADQEEDEEGWCGYGVDSANGCFVDARTAQMILRKLDDDPEFLFEKLNTEGTYFSTNVAVEPDSGANLIAFTSGAGDGSYASHFGYDAGGRVACLVTDFGLFEYDD